MLVTSETKVNYPTLPAGLGDRHHSGLGLKVAKRFPATRAIAEFGPDRRHQGPAVSARQRLGNRSGQARGEKTLDLMVVALHRFDRSPQLIDQNLDQLRFGSDHMLGYLKLRWAKFLPQLLTALFAQVMLLGGKAVEFFTFQRTQMSRGWIACKKIQSQLRVQVPKGVQGPGIILFERDGELIEQASFVTPHSALIPAQHLKLLSFLRTRLQRFQVRLIGSEKLRQHIGVKRIALRATHPIAIPHSIHRLGINRINLHPVVEQKVHYPPRRLLNGRSKLPPPRLFARRANAPSRPAPPRSLVLLYLLLSCPPHHLRTPDAAGLPNPLLCNIVSRSLAPPL